MSEPEPSRPGSILRAEREALGVTVREVAETLNLSMSMVEAIEADDHDRLPGPVFARGYVRAYARLLELDPQPLMAQYPPATDPGPPVHAAREWPAREWARRRPGLILGGAAALLALMLVLLVVWLWPEAPPERPEPSPTAAESSELQPTAVESSEPQPAAVELSEPQPAAEPATSPAVPAPSPADAGPDVRRITGTGNDRLTFEFSDDCWVEVRSTGGGNLYSDLGRADSRLELVGQGPFRILLGYAPGVQVFFNDEAVPLAPHTRDNVATLVLGQ